VIYSANLTIGQVHVYIFGKFFVALKHNES